MPAAAVRGREGSQNGRYAARWPYRLPSSSSSVCNSSPRLLYEQLNGSWSSQGACYESDNRRIGWLELLMS